jgi:hypothetical protein
VDGERNGMVEEEKKENKQEENKKNKKKEQREGREVDQSRMKRGRQERSRMKEIFGLSTSSPSPALHRMSTTNSAPLFLAQPLLVSFFAFFLLELIQKALPWLLDRIFVDHVRSLCSQFVAPLF